MGAIGFGAGLALRQRRTTAAVAFDLTGDTLPAGATVTRASPGARTTAAGTIAIEPANVARLDRWPGGAVRGLLVEPAATNLHTGSAQFDDTAFWGKGASSVSANAGVAPDGAMAADLWICAGGGGNPSRITTAAPVAAGGGLVASVYARRGNHDWVRLQLGTDTSGTNGVQLWANLASGAAGMVAAIGSGWTAGAGAVEDAGQGWWRLSVAGTTSGGSAAIWITGAAGDGSAIRPDVGNGAGIGASVSLWGAQIETGAAATTPIATGGAAASRVADVLVIDWGARGVADGAMTARYMFDDGAAQDVPTMVAGGTATAPSELIRRRLRRVERV